MLSQHIRESRLQINTCTKDNGAPKKHRTAYKYYNENPTKKDFVLLEIYARLVSFYNYSLQMGWLRKDYLGKSLLWKGPIKKQSTLETTDRLYYAR